MGMDKKNTLRVAVYCRVAQESQLGMDCQRELLERYALSLGYSRLVHYGDNGASGLTLDRPGFKQMEADIQAGKIGAVLVKDIARIGRELRQTTAWIDRTIGRGVGIITPEGPYKPFEFPEWDTLHRAYTSRQSKPQAKERK